MDATAKQINAIPEQRNELADELVQTKRAAKNEARDLITAVLDRDIF